MVTNLSWQDVNIENTLSTKDDNDENQIDDITQAHDSYYLKLLPSDLLTSITEYESLKSVPPKNICVGGESIQIPNSFFLLLVKKHLLHFCSSMFISDLLIE